MIKKITSLKQWIVSITAIIVIIIGTVILVAFAQGYSYDALHNQIYKTGLVLVDSTPNNADIYINSRKTDKKTPYRYSGAPAGNIDVGLYRSQYRNWMKKAVVVPGEVTFVNYAMLIPEVLEQKQIDANIVFSNILQSENKQKTFGISKNPLAIYAISDDGNSKQVYSPAASGNPSADVVDFQNLQLSRDGQRLLFNQKIANGSMQKVVLDTSSAKLNNLTEEFGFSFVDLRFNPKNSSELFWLESGVLKKVQINDKNISSNIIDSIFQLDIEEDRLLVFKRTPSNENTVELYAYDLNGDNETLIEQFTFDPSGYDISFIKSRFAEYISLIYISTQNAELIKNPYQKTNNTLSIKQIGSNVTHQTISPNNRFLVYNQNNTLRLIDLEFGQDDNFGTELLGLQRWTWYDDYHMVIQQNSGLRLMDYDGQNNYLLTPISDIAEFAVWNNQKAIAPLNKTGSLYKLFLTKK